MSYTKECDVVECEVENCEVNKCEDEESSTGGVSPLVTLATAVGTVTLGSNSSDKTVDTIMLKTLFVEYIQCEQQKMQSLYKLIVCMHENFVLYGDVLVASENKLKLSKSAQSIIHDLIPDRRNKHRNLLERYSVNFAAYLIMTGKAAKDVTFDGDFLLLYMFC